METHHYIIAGVSFIVGGVAIATSKYWMKRLGNWLWEKITGTNG